MRPTEPLERLLAFVRARWMASGTGDPGVAVRRLPWRDAPPANPTRIADALRIHGVPVLGGTVPPSERTNFLRDPATSRSWPEGRGVLDVPGLDARLAWELGRLQHLALLADAVPTDPIARDDARAFRARHPVGQGFAWASCLEVALRLVSLAQVVARWPAPDLRLAIAEHAHWLLKWPSVGSSARNHRVAELGALAVAAWVLPEATDANAWRAEAEQLPDVLRAQLHQDGGGVEQSTHYLAFVVEWALIARSVGVLALDEPLRRAVRFLRSLVGPAGRSARIGDDDNGRVVPCHLGAEPDYVTSVTGAAAVALGELPPTGWRPDRRSGLLSGAPPAARFTPCSAWFPDTGLVVFRGMGRMVVFDHGTLGEPHLGAHGHADALAVWVHLDDGPLIVGRGTHSYNQDSALRRFHRGSLAHPTVSVDGLSQSQPHAHPFLWRSRARGVLHELDLARGVAVGSHDGYVERLGVVHRRRLEAMEHGLRIEDALLGSGSHLLSIHLPLAPGSSALVGTDGVEIRAFGRLRATIVPDPRCKPLLLTSAQGLGAHSGHYGDHEPATTVLLQARCRLPVELCTIVRLQRR